MVRPGDDKGPEMRPFPMSTPGKALQHLQKLPARQAARACGWVLEQWVRQHSARRQASLPRSPRVMALLDAHDTPEAQLIAHLQDWLVSVSTTARRAREALASRERLSGSERRVAARLRELRRLCERLSTSLEHPRTRAQLQGVQLTD